MLKNSKFINEEKIKQEKERKKLKIDNEKNKIRQFIKNKRKEIKNKTDNDNIDTNIDFNNNNFIFTTEELNADNIQNQNQEDIKEDKKEKKNKIKNKKKIKKEDKKVIEEEDQKEKIINKDKEDKKDIDFKTSKKKVEHRNKIKNNKSQKKKNSTKSFIKIVDMSKDKKYIDAEIRLKRTKENCEKANELVLEIDHKIKEDKKLLKNPEYITTKKQKDELEEKAKKIIEEVKSNIDINNFSIKKLNKEDQKLMKGGKRYDPNKREKKTENVEIDKNKEPVLLSSINSVKEIKEKNKEFNDIFKRSNMMDDKEKNVEQKWRNDNECTNAYINIFNKE